MGNNSVPVEEKNPLSENSLESFASLLGMLCEYMFKRELPHIKEAMKITRPDIDMEDEKVVDLILLGYKAGVSSVLMKGGM